MSIPITLSNGPRLQKALTTIDGIIDKQNQSVHVVVELLVIESFGTRKDSELAHEILAPIKEKYKNA